MEHVAIRDQGQSGTCYAESVSQMYDAWRFMNGDTRYKEQTSATEAVLGFAKNSEKKSLGGSLNGESELLEYIQSRGGSCSRKYIADNFSGSGDPNFVGSVENIFASYAKKRGEKLSQIKRAESRSEIPMRGERTNDFLSASQDATFVASKKGIAEFQMADFLAGKELKQDLGTCFTNFDVSPKSDLEKSLGNLLSAGNSVKFLDLYAPVKCPQKDRLKAEKKFETDSSWWSPFDHLKKNLTNKKSMPVLLDICADILTSGKTFDESCAANHAVLVIGSRKNQRTQKCELLIRNSWGTDCSTYSKDWSCNNSDGAVWVEAGYLKKATWASTSIH